MQIPLRGRDFGDEDTPTSQPVDGNFIRVRTGENVLGYVARSAPIAASSDAGRGVQ
jgi:hypothetical protein